MFMVHCVDDCDKSPQQIIKVSTYMSNVYFLLHVMHAFVLFLFIYYDSAVMYNVFFPILFVVTDAEKAKNVMLISVFKYKTGFYFLLIHRKLLRKLKNCSTTCKVYQLWITRVDQ